MIQLILVKIPLNNYNNLLEMDPKITNKFTKHLLQHFKKEIILY